MKIDLSNASAEDFKTVQDNLDTYDLIIHPSKHITRLGYDELTTGRYTNNLDINNISLDGKILTITFEDDHKFDMEKIEDMTVDEPGSSKIDYVTVSFYNDTNEVMMVDAQYV